MLANGDTVKSTVANNIINPDADMTGWVKTSSASQIFDESGKTQQEVNNLIQVESISSLRSIYAKSKGDKAYLVSVIKDKNKGGGTFVATNKGSLVDNGGTIVSSANPTLVWVRISYEVVDPFMFGALADNVFDDTDALTRMSQFTNVVHFKKGSYVYNGLGLNPSNQNWSYTSDGKEMVTVTLGASSRLIDTATGTNRITLSDFTFIGGLGAFRCTNTGSLVGGRKTIARNSFENYTKCAIETNHNDMPYWDITCNSFSAATSTGTIGIALSRNSDASLIKGNSFLRNEVHIKARVSGKFDIESNDFIMFDKLNTSGRAHIWLVASATTPIHVGITGNKFGNENQVSTDYPILIAAELSSAGGNGEKLPDYALATPEGVYRLTVGKNLISGASGYKSFVRTLSPQLRYASFEGNILNGALPANFINAVNGLDSRYAAIYFDSMFSEAFVTLGASLCNVANANIFIKDGVLNPLLPNAFSDVSTANRAEYNNILTQRVVLFGTSGCTTADVADADGKNNAITISVNSANAIINSALYEVTNNLPIRIEFDVSTSDPSQVIFVQMYSQAGAMLKQYAVTDISDTNKTYKIAMPSTLGSGQFRLRFQFQKTGSIKLGRVKMYQSRYPINTGLSTLDSAKILTMSAIYADDAAAAIGGITVGEMYCSTGGVVKVRLN